MTKKESDKLLQIFKDSSLTERWYLLIEAVKNTLLAEYRKTKYSDPNIDDTIMDISVKCMEDLQRKGEEYIQSLNSLPSFIWYRIANICYNKQRVWNETHITINDNFEGDTEEDEIE